MSELDYKVGYGRPPEVTRFKPGQSGNPKGRPKGARNFQTEIEAELNARVEVTENGRRKKVSKRTVVAKQLVNNGAQGDPKAIGLLLQNERQAEAAKQAPQAMAIEVLPVDLLVMKSIVKRIREMEVLPHLAEEEEEAP